MGILFLIAGAAAVLLGIFLIVRFTSCGRFPRVDGRLLSKSVSMQRSTESGQPSRMYSAVVSYGYTVGGTDYTSSRIYSLFTLSRGSRASVEKFCDSLVAMSPLPVYYDPKKPGFAFLRNGPVFPAIIIIAVGIAFVVIGAFNL